MNDGASMETIFLSELNNFHAFDSSTRIRSSENV